MEKAYKSIIYYILLFFICSLIFSIISTSFKDYFDSNLNAKYLVNNITNLVTYLIITFTLIFINRKSFTRDFKSFNMKTLIKILRGFILIFFTSFIMGNIFDNVSDNQQNVNNMANYKALLIIHAGLLAPICEEIVFRKSIFDIIKNPIIFVIISGLIFGFIHCLSGDFQNIIKYAIPGFVFSLLYLYDKNTTSNIIIHALYNIFTILLIL